MPGFKLGVADSEQEMENRVKDAAGFVRREVACGFNGDHDEPQDGGDPSLENIASMRVQAVRWTSKSPPSREKRDKDRAPKFTRERLLPLFDGIVRGLTGNHDIVHVALAETGSADADETSFLQQFWNRRAATVAHARLEAANHLLDDHRYGPAVGNAAFNTFRDEFGETVRFAVGPGD
jgi:hypothetical protein